MLTTCWSARADCWSASDSKGMTIRGLHCFATGSFALGSKLFSGLAVQTLGICMLGAGLGNRFLVGLAHLSHRRGLTRWRLCKGRSQTHHKGQERCANEGEPFQHDRHPPFADNPKPYPKVGVDPDVKLSAVCYMVRSRADLLPCRCGNSSKRMIYASADSSPVFTSIQTTPPTSGAGCWGSACRQALAELET